MSDDELRRLERETRGGDPMAIKRYHDFRKRLGLPNYTWQQHQTTRHLINEEDWSRYQIFNIDLTIQIAREGGDLDDPFRFSRAAGREDNRPIVRSLCGRVEWDPQNREEDAYSAEEMLGPEYQFKKCKKCISIFNSRRKRETQNLGKNPFDGESSMSHNILSYNSVMEIHH